jgi:hypothetical protein
MLRQKWASKSLSSSETTAVSIKRLLSLGAKVLDWQTDLIPERTLLDQIEQDAARSIGGIFLFTKDDDLIDHGQRETAVPRDNVVRSRLLHWSERKAQRTDHS